MSVEIEALFDALNGTQILSPETVGPMVDYFNNMRDVLLPPQNVIDAIEAHTPAWWHSIVGCIVYKLVSKAIVMANKPRPGVEFKEPAFVKPLAIVHNTIMTLYSMWSFLAMLSMMAPFFLTMNTDVFLSKDGSVIYNTVRGYGMVVNIFYFSKYYEFMDTWLLYLKGKNPIFLQTFHHMGAAICLSILSYVQCDIAYVFVMFNSFIHSLMYFYYLLTTLNVRPTWKYLVTTAQLIQFYVGVPFSLINAFRGCYYRDGFVSSKCIGLVVNDLYVMCLVVLFREFYKKTYKKPENDERESKKGKKEN